MTSEDIVFTKRCIAEALINLMMSKEYQDISISEICKASGYSRMTYYRSFSSKDDILITYMTILADQFRHDVITKAPQADSRSYEILLYAFRYFGEYHRFVECLAKANLSSVLQYGINYYMDTYLVGRDESIQKHYAVYYYAGGLFNIFSVWIANGMQETPEEMAQTVFERMNKKHEVL